MSVSPYDSAPRSAPDSAPDSAPGSMPGSLPESAPSKMPGHGRLALVTGASGFVGSHLVEVLLGRGWRVRCLVRGTTNLRWLPAERIALAHADLRDDTPAGAAALDDALRGATVVFHLAALTSAATDAEYYRVNVAGTARLAASVARTAEGTRFVFCSSLAAAGPPRPGRPAREEDEARPKSAYGRSKLDAERVLGDAGVPHVVVRPPAVYGPRDVDILAAFRLAARGLALRLAPPGQRLSLVHASDLARGLAMAAEQSACGLYYLSDGAVHTWEEVTAGIAAAVGRRVRVVPVPRAAALLAAHLDRGRARALRRKPLLTPDRVRELAAPEWTCDDTRARRELGYASRVALADGLRQTAAWYRARGWL